MRQNTVVGMLWPWINASAPSPPPPPRLCHAQPAVRCFHLPPVQNNHVSARQMFKSCQLWIRALCCDMMICTDQVPSSLWTDLPRQCFDMYLPHRSTAPSQACRCRLRPGWGRQRHAVPGRGKLHVGRWAAPDRVPAHSAKVQGKGSTQRHAGTAGREPGHRSAPVAAAVGQRASTAWPSKRFRVGSRAGVRAAAARLSARACRAPAAAAGSLTTLHLQEPVRSCCT